MSATTIRQAVPSDIPFLVEACLAAEKSGGEHAPIARIFGLGEAEIRPLLHLLFEEGIDGCEFSVSSFLIAERDGDAAGAVAAWVEGVAEDGLPSSLLRANLIGFTFPADAIAAMRENGPAIAPLQLARTPQSLQIEYVYTAAAHRGHGLASLLIEEHIRRVDPSSVTMVQVQVFEHNLPAIHIYTALGFRCVRSVHTEHTLAATLLPDRTKLLMERPLVLN